MNSNIDTKQPREVSKSMKLAHKIVKLSHKRREFNQRDADMRSDR